MEKFTGIILAGGKSSRMQQDKALLKFREKFFFEILYDRLKDFCTKVIISTNNPEVKINAVNCVSVPDIIKNAGPGGGIYSALDASETEKNLIVSVDTPFVPKELFDFLIKANRQDFVVTVISEGETLHPLIGIYSKKFTDILFSELNSGNKKIRDIIRKVPYNIADIKKESFYNGLILKNINTQAEYNAILKL